ncbi:uncharacterized protein LOC128668019 [Microplitis demolitor]|uniref:uncharacterized protein LOC128668019 n=1 Tax=Microplitis demolitor TaxID=69319 RepID=UPI00235B6BA7|nr:uncharacterized protein LOC128668019 [Microplitis demolitor]
MRHLLECREFTVQTDHKPLVYAFQQKLDKASPRQIRQLSFISQFTTDIIHVKGEENSVADALSRTNTIDVPTMLSSQRIAEAQEQDQELQKIQEQSSLKLQRLNIEGQQIYCNIFKNIVRPYIPKELRKLAFEPVHGYAHPSGRNTSKTLREKYIWPGIRKDAAQWSKECLQCQKSKIQRHNRMNHLKIDVSDARFNHINIDIIMLSDVDGYRYCLTIIDRFSRWPTAVPLKDIKTETIVTTLFNNWICFFGTPLKITTDQGAQIESALFKGLTRFIGANKIRTSPYHPASNGIIERWHRTLKAALMCKTGVPWIHALPSVLLGLRTTYKEDIKSSPAEMLFGTTLRVPGEFFVHQELPTDPQAFLENHRKAMRMMQPTQTAHHSKPKVFIHKDLDKCSHVFIRCDHVKAPLEQPYRGPFKVIERLSDRLFRVDVEGQEKNILIERLKPAYLPREELEENETEQSNENENVSPRAMIAKGVEIPANRVKDTEGGVDVAVPYQLSQSTERWQQDSRDESTNSRRRPRKQTIQFRLPFE